MVLVATPNSWARSDSMASGNSWDMTFQREFINFAGMSGVGFG